MYTVTHKMHEYICLVFCMIMFKTHSTKYVQKIQIFIIQVPQVL